MARIFLKPFRFEQFWIRDSSCYHVIANAWHSNPSGLSDIHYKLAATSKALCSWKKIHFGYIPGRIKQISPKLQKVQQLSPTQANILYEQHLKLLLDEQLQCEQLLWKQNPGYIGSSPEISTQNTSMLPPLLGVAELISSLKGPNDS